MDAIVGLALASGLNWLIQGQLDPSRLRIRIILERTLTSTLRYECTLPIPPDLSPEDTSLRGANLTRREIPA